MGPNGPLPLHVTEYARDRLRNADDRTMARFFDLFHHRMLMLFYRVWASGRPTVNHDRPATDRFSSTSARSREWAWPGFASATTFRNAAELFFAGRLGAQTRNAEGLRAIIE